MSVLSACNMPLLLNFCSVLHDHSDRYRRMFLKTHAGDRDVPGEHSRIAELTMARRTDEACALLRQHIGRTGENVRLALTTMPSQPTAKPGRTTQTRAGAGQPS
jgi:DNA-binding GntR family transcriptional regulator